MRRKNSLVDITKKVQFDPEVQERIQGTHLESRALYDPDQLSGPPDLLFGVTVSDDLLRGTKDPLLLLSPKLRTA
ncbi:MAG: hypothetical protein A3H63_02515 [Candidatus Harrisonbacteria bacterium RIFCSPLOWO2_02_FULL_45_10c]|uniref:Uncharacterized protein n=1 Tax=Candidatus Harrisonbacteria bacterium RIFCSPLOWO2_02_FULL_45_10c TaxID=1798410 RepID=A0A1G1ZQH2_9BACT|nr:MAG: hypothetical protein A3H63_02515 [Candidatus Harrisonbacteria bacterium RIFCSPLOWO2_02_FULL_45_10c]